MLLTDVVMPDLALPRLGGARRRRARPGRRGVLEEIGPAAARGLGGVERALVRLQRGADHQRGAEQHRLEDHQLHRVTGGDAGEDRTKAPAGPDHQRDSRAGDRREQQRGPPAEEQAGPDRQQRIDQGRHRGHPRVAVERDGDLAPHRANGDERGEERPPGGDREGSDGQRGDDDVLGLVAPANEVGRRRPRWCSRRPPRRWPSAPSRSAGGRPCRRW